MNQTFPTPKLLSRWAVPALTVLFFLAGPGLLSLFAQTNSPPRGLSSNRYLLVVETSRSMKRRTDGAFNAIAAGLTSCLQGQLRPGDTLGVWTFNKELSAGTFPLEWWPARGQAAVTDHVLGFLQAQKFEKQANLDKVVPDLLSLIKESDVFTVLLVTSGESNFHGTPFDDPINQAFKASRDQQQKERMPFITVLRSKHGVLTDYRVSAAQWPVEMPPLPPGPEVAKVAETETKAATKPAPPTAPPLIIHGKKPEAAKAEAAPQVPLSASTNAALPAPGKPVSAATQASTVVPLPLAEPKSEPAKAPRETPKVIVAALLQTSNAPAVPLPAAVPNPVPPKPAPVPHPEPSLAETSARSSGSAAKPRATDAAPVRSSEPRPSAITALSASAQAGVATPLKTASAHDPLWTAASVLLGAGLCAALLWLRRPRGAPQASLITRSLEPRIK